jgi:hypothetical protein
MMGETAKEDTAASLNMMGETAKNDTKGYLCCARLCSLACHDGAGLGQEPGLIICY